MSDGLTKAEGLRYRPLCHVVKTDSNRVIDETKTYLETNGSKALKGRTSYTYDCAGNVVY